LSLRIPFHHGGGGFVASRFDAENDHQCINGLVLRAARAVSKTTAAIAGAVCPDCLQSGLTAVRITASASFGNGSLSP
jgi:hypothetical protein